MLLEVNPLPQSLGIPSFRSLFFRFLSAATTAEHPAADLGSAENWTYDRTANRALVPKLARADVTSDRPGRMHLPALGSWESDTVAPGAKGQTGPDRPNPITRTPF